MYMPKKNTATDVKYHNRNLIYQYVLREENLSQKEIAENLQLSLPTVIQNLNELKEKNLILEQGHYQSTGGRKAKRIAPNTMARVAIGLDITKNHIALVLTNLVGDIIEKQRIRCIYSDTPAFYSNVSRLIDEMLFKHSIDTSSILGLGVSIPCIITPDHKTIFYSNLIPGMPEGQLLYEHFSSYFDYPIYIENDASSGSLGEFWNSTGNDNIFYLFISNSVGGAIYYNNQLYAGDNCHSAEIGHTTLVPNGNKCYCGRSGCVDAYCSAAVLADFTHGTLNDFMDKLAAGEPAYVEKWNEYLDYLSVTIMNIRMLFDCDIVIGGYMGSCIVPYLDQLKMRIIAQDIFSPNADFVRACKLQTECSALGVALTFIDSFRKSI
ncbi:MAG: ROK family transcriptional regulator [Lachnospiraceae bacterium]|nr:ROK family transcriptional regulator [Lachnospiraceae bacterium]